MFAPAHSQQDLRLRIAVGPQGAREVWVSRNEGLFIVDRDAGARRTPLGDGHSARFDDDGRLVFERGYDDGHRMILEETQVVDPGAHAARAAFRWERLPDYQPIAAPAQQDAPVKVCIDPGHGGSDPGAIGFGLREADIVLDVALRLRRLLDADTHDPSGGGEWDVLMTRSADVTVSLSTRTTLANAFGAASFSSIHANAFSSPAANGTETYCFAEGSTAALLRDRIHNLMIESWQLTNRGVKTANFFVLVNTVMPASLSELGFITSPVDVHKLESPHARQRAALAHLFALQRHHGFGAFNPLGDL